MDYEDMTEEIQWIKSKRTKGIVSILIYILAFVVLFLLIKNFTVFVFVYGFFCLLRPVYDRLRKPKTTFISEDIQFIKQKGRISSVIVGIIATYLLLAVFTVGLTALLPNFAFLPTILLYFVLIRFALFPIVKDFYDIIVCSRMLKKQNEEEIVQASYKQEGFEKKVKFISRIAVFALIVVGVIAQIIQLVVVPPTLCDKIDNTVAFNHYNQEEAAEIVKHLTTLVDTEFSDFNTECTAKYTDTVEENGNVVRYDYTVFYKYVSMYDEWWARTAKGVITVEKLNTSGTWKGEGRDGFISLMGENIPLEVRIDSLTETEVKGHYSVSVGNEQYESDFSGSVIHEGTLFQADAKLDVMREGFFDLKDDNFSFLYNFEEDTITLTTSDYTGTLNRVK